MASAGRRRARWIFLTLRGISGRRLGRKESFHHFLQLFQLERLAQRRIGIDVARLVGHVAIRGEDDQRHVRSHVLFAQPPDQRPTIDHRHHQIDDHQVGLRVARQRQRGLRIAGLVHRIAPFAEDLAGRLQDPAQRFDLVRADTVEQHARDVGEDALAPLRLGEPRPILPPDVRHGSGWERHGRLFATFPRSARRADGPAVWYGARPMMAITPRIVAAHGLSQDEYARIRKVLGRDPNIVELGVFSAMWSEHCSYKSSRRLLRHLPTKGPRVLQGPGENAGVIDVGGGLAVAFKMESHNHPSYIEPYQGAATGVGGILRDVFTMGARPIASMNALRFGDPSHPKTARLLEGVVAGIAGYGNCIGVPTVAGEIALDASFNGNCLVNAFTLGLLKSNRIFRGTASGVGNPVIYIGARTGRDGIHGATMASAEFDQESESKRPTVQVGDPFMEKLLLEACLELFKTDCLVGIQDMGAAGLTSSSVEMASRAGSGLLLDIDAVPRRETGMTPYEVMLSESQERMLLVAKKGREREVFELCDKWELAD